MPDSKSVPSVTSQRVRQRINICYQIFSRVRVGSRGQLLTSDCLETRVAASVTFEGELQTLHSEEKK